MRGDYERLLDVQEAIEHIEKYAGRGRDVFERDELLQTWMVHYLQILGEACANLTDEIKQRHSEVSWKEIVGMRNVLVHGYFNIDLDVVWNTVAKDIPDLKSAILRVLAEEKPEEDASEA
ncbi:DUF86 domain-containing protein [Verrucomicrobiota bacterium]